MAEITTDAQRVRLLISDVGGESGSDFIFDNDEINGFLGMETNVYRAASVALLTLAANEALVQKRIKYLELSTDGAATAEALRKLASDLNDRADTADDDDVLPEFASMGDSAFTRRDQYLGLASVEDE
jgi:hypothetical protein